MKNQKSEGTPKKTTVNGNKLFEGAKDGKPFVKGVPKTDAEKKAISQGMRDANNRRKAYADLLETLIHQLKLDLKDGKVPPKDTITAIDTLINALGDKVNKQEIIGNLGLEKVFITKEDTKQTDNHIDEFLND